ncbi:hypothetical protein B0H16DRAFT_1506373 [Mycena metata]|uniref:Peptidase M20 dimerisation domain-containing protein n=1 Tax=Mycena metata TaxID=1033252 RepID=A0AAD7K1H8_9AGAR|nr:hypothetical protein B0H16DRAFT_1506373 [Mycena metata]
MRGLPLHDGTSGRKSRTWSKSAGLLGLVVTGLLISTYPRLAGLNFGGTNTISDSTKLPLACPTQPSAITPAIPFSVPSTAAERDYYVDKLRGAVRVRTETFDNGPTDGGAAWYDKFYALEAYLLKAYPDVFANLKVERFATHALLFTWQGSDPSLQPIVLMAHQDTVPVPPETLERWTHPPFEAHLDAEGWVWGRGAGDCKNLLTAHLSAVSELLAAGFEPTRTVHLSFGFDEEGGAVRSARYIAAHLEELYGLNSILMIVDEGGDIQEHHGRTWIAPSLGEKGSVNVQVTVNVPGGHSSIPPKHTAIGILSALVTTIEANPPPFTLSAKNPFSTFVGCLAEYGTLDAELKNLLAHEETWPEAAALMAERDPADGARLSTTQAVDIVSGGVKVNALPEAAYAVVNHRVSADDSVQGVYDRYVELLTPEVAKFNLSIVPVGESPPAGATRYLQLSSPRGAEASPVTPAEGSAWEIFAGTSLHFFPDAIVAPYLSTGGTDTRSYVNLTRAIYRFQAVRSDERAQIHTVDERMHVDGHLNAIAWVHALIQNADSFRE